MKALKTLICLQSLFQALYGLTHSGQVDAFRDRAIYQVLTDRIISDGREPACQNLKQHCGGTFRDVANILPYIKERLGFSGIYISPFVENTEGGYHGYWAKNFYQVNQNFGTEEDLKALVQEAHKMDIKVMVDVVFNHVGYVPNGNDFSGITPFNQDEHYHAACEITQQDWDTNNRHAIETCRLWGLPDLNTESEAVKRLLFDWITKDVIEKYSFDALRIDTVRHVGIRFWQELSHILEGFPIYTLGEVMHGDQKLVKEYQISGGLDGVMDYPRYYKMVNVFVKGTEGLQALRDLYLQEKSNVNTIATFIDNHDVRRIFNQLSERYPKNSDDQRAVLLNMMTYIYMSYGIPIWYYGTEAKFNGGDDPFNREVYDPILRHASLFDATIGHYLKILNELKRTRGGLSHSKIEFRHVETKKLLSFSKGLDFYVILTTSQSEIMHEVRALTEHPYSPGDMLCNVFHEDTDCVTIDDQGNMVVKIIQGYPKVYQLKPKNDQPPLNNQFLRQPTRILLLLTIVLGLLLLLLISHRGYWGVNTGSSIDSIDKKDF